MPWPPPTPHPLPDPPGLHVIPRLTHSGDPRAGGRVRAVVLTPPPPGLQGTRTRPETQQGSGEPQDWGEDRHPNSRLPPTPPPAEAGVKGRWPPQGLHGGAGRMGAWALAGSGAVLTEAQIPRGPPRRTCPAVSPLATRWRGFPTKCAQSVWAKWGVTAEPDAPSALPGPSQPPGVPDTCCLEGAFSPHPHLQLPLLQGILCSPITSRPSLPTCRRPPFPCQHPTPRASLVKKRRETDGGRTAR